MSLVAVVMGRKWNHPLCAADCRMYVCGLCAWGGVAGGSTATSSLDHCQLSWGSSSCLLSCALPAPIHVGAPNHSIHVSPPRVALLGAVPMSRHGSM